MVIYEWDCETVSAPQTVNNVEGECHDHKYSETYASALADSLKVAPDGFRFQIVLVRDDDEGRAWASVEGGVIPEWFTDADGEPTSKVPKKFHAEVEKTRSKNT